MLDVNMFREDKGGNPEAIRESQRRRFADVSLVDEVISIDNEYRKALFDRTQLQTQRNDINKEIGKKKKAKEDADDLIKKSKEVDRETKELELRADALLVQRDAKIKLIGNIVHESAPVDNDEENNVVVKTFGDCEAKKALNHVDVMERLDWIDTESGSAIAGSRGYFLRNEAVLLNQALITLGMSFLVSRDYTPLHAPSFMLRPMMAKTAQLSQFDEELYHVSGKSRSEKTEPDADAAATDLFLIATSEQPISCYHHGQRFIDKDLPIKYAGYSSCFRKEAGSHGRDTRGIFRVHEFQKVEQFVICSPEESWKEHDAMIANASEFYEKLNIPYRIVNMVSGALNDAAAKKFDLEAWFPGSGAFRELVSASNCTDFQSRALEVRFGPKVKGDQGKFVHMLNSTLAATSRVMCAIVENNQTDEGINIPEVLRPFMGGIDFIKYRKELTPVEEPKSKSKKK